jgi:hypothetical protein
VDFAVEVKEVLGEGGGQCRRGDCGGGLKGGMGRWKRWGNGRNRGASGVLSMVEEGWRRD